MVVFSNKTEALIIFLLPVGVGYKPEVIHNVEQIWSQFYSQCKKNREIKKPLDRAAYILKVGGVLGLCNQID